jgi:hypothetical protein
MRECICIIICVVLGFAHAFALGFALEFALGFTLRFALGFTLMFSSAFSLITYVATGAPNLLENDFFYINSSFLPSFSEQTVLFVFVQPSAIPAAWLRLS